MAMRELTPGTHVLDLSFGCAAHNQQRLAYWGRNLPFSTEFPFAGSARSHITSASSGRYGSSPVADRDSVFGRSKRTVDELWREFFSDPSQWWDNRSDKQDSRYPDFKHKTTREGLWLDGKMTPPWVEAELAAMVAGPVQLRIFSSNKRLAKYVKTGQYEKTLEHFREMQEQGLNPDTFTYVSVLNACARLKSLEEGKSVHAQIKKGGFELDLYVGSSLIDMYTKCGSVDDARKLFNRMPVRNDICWHVMILGYIKSGEPQKALDLFRKMQKEAIEPKHATFVAVLNGCAKVGALEIGRHAHEMIIKRDLESNPFILSSLLDMYTKCGSLEDASTLFNKMPTHDLVSWNAMIMGLVKCEQARRALELYQQMQKEMVEPDTITFVAILKACASVLALEEGRHFHEQIIDRGYESDVFVSTSLIDMYCKCGSIEDAWRVFDKMPKRTVVSWNAMILGSVKCGQGKRAMELFHRMQQEGVELVPLTFVGILNACASLGTLEEGRRVHEQIIQRGFEYDVFVGTSLIDMYTKCGSVEDAWKVFNNLSTRNIASWNAMIMGHVKCGEGTKALEVFHQMQREGVEPDPTTFVAVLNACASIEKLEEGRQIHEQIIEKDCESNVFVGTSLIDFYAKCGCIEDAWRIFSNMPTRTVVSWNAMILGHVNCGEGHKALELFQQMQQEGLELDATTFLGVLSACASVQGLAEGKDVHQKIVNRGFETDVFVASSLVDMYVKCGSIEDAWKVFNKVSAHQVASWNTMIQGLVKCGQGHKALELFSRMQAENVGPDRVTFVALIDACTSISALEEGKYFHKQIIEKGYGCDVFVGASLVDMYAKCGSVDDAEKVFNNMPTRTKLTWNSMLNGYAVHGHRKEAIEHFEKMCEEGIEMDDFTFTCLLSACSQAGLVDEGMHYFQSMNVVHKVLPAVEHYTCMINLLASAGRQSDADDLKKKMMLCKPNATL